MVLEHLQATNEELRSMRERKESMLLEDTSISELQRVANRAARKYLHNPSTTTNARLLEATERLQTAKIAKARAEAGESGHKDDSDGRAAALAGAPQGGACQVSTAERGRRTGGRA